MIQPLTIEEHQQLADKLYAIKLALHDLMPNDSNHKKFSCKESDKLLKIDRLVGNLRSYFEERLFREHGNKASTKIYYGRD